MHWERCPSCAFVAGFGTKHWADIGGLASPGIQYKQPATKVMQDVEQVTQALQTIRDQAASAAEVIPQTRRGLSLPTTKKDSVLLNEE